jgi:hypothetical protein
VPKKQGEKPTILPEVHRLLIAATEGTTFGRVFAIAHEIVSKDEKWRKNGRTYILLFSRRVVLRLFSLPGARENSGKTRTQRDNKRSENMKFRHIVPW